MIQLYTCAWTDGHVPGGDALSSEDSLVPLERSGPNLYTETLSTQNAEALGLARLARVPRALARPRADRYLPVYQCVFARKDPHKASIAALFSVTRCSYS